MVYARHKCVPWRLVKIWDQPREKRPKYAPSKHLYSLQSYTIFSARSTVTPQCPRISFTLSIYFSRSLPRSHLRLPTLLTTVSLLSNTHFTILFTCLYNLIVFSFVTSSSPSRTPTSSQILSFFILSGFYTPIIALRLSICIVIFSLFLLLYHSFISIHQSESTDPCNTCTL